ncbi:hypothetical protein BASA60_009225 [Batrachochytrium salamandrivorans]|nr:hypothetical protein BASA60_009225 [Batrachochytrium salamandrivorans]
MSAGSTARLLPAHIPSMHSFKPSVASTHPRASITTAAATATAAKTAALITPVITAGTHPGSRYSVSASQKHRLLSASSTRSNSTARNTNGSNSKNAVSDAIPTPSPSHSHLGMGGIFSSVDTSLSSSDQTIQSLPEIHQRTMVMPDPIGKNTAKLRVSAIIPNEIFLSKMFKSGSFTIQPKEVSKLTQFLIDNYSSCTPTELSNKIKEQFPKAVESDILFLIKVLWKHSDAGGPIALALAQSGIHCGNMEAEFQYSKMLMKGMPGVPPNRELAMVHVRSLADRSHGGAIYILALQAIQAQRKSEAGRLMALSAENGFALAQFQMGSWLAVDGSVMIKDPSRAVGYLTSAHKQGVVEATYMLSVMYSRGVGAPNKKPDYKKAHDLLLEAAEKGLSVAQHDLGSVYYEGQVDVPRNVSLGLEYWSMASEGGFALSQINIAKVRMTGIHVTGPGGGTIEKDWSIAREMLERAVVDCKKLNAELLGDIELLIKDLDELEKLHPEEAAKYRAQAKKRKTGTGSCNIL